MKTDMLIDLVAFQAEGVTPLFDRLDSLKLTSITITPFFFEESGDVKDLRLPPLDLDGQARELDRPLQNGERVKHGKRYLMFEPNRDNYGSSSYYHKWKDIGSDLCNDVIEEGRKRGYKVNLTLPSPSDINLEDAPKDLFGTPQFPKISQKGCINNKKVIDAYKGALRDLISQYNPNGINVDWIEYTNYYFTDNLLCFCSDCRAEAGKQGIDFTAFEKSVQSVYTWVAEVKELPPLEYENWNSLWETMGPGIGEFFNFKALSCSALIKSLKEVLLESSKTDIELIFPGFAPPMNIGTGFHYNQLAESAKNIQIQPKGYRFHWGLMVRWYAEELSRMNKHIPFESWIPFTEKLLEVSEEVPLGSKQYTMPAPNERGPISTTREFEKLDDAWNSVKDKSKVAFRLHAYGPVSLFKERVEYGNSGPYDEVHIQRYGYSADDKLEFLK